MIFEGSRYKNTDAYIDKNNNRVFANRRRLDFNPGDCSIHVFKSFDRLDNLAEEYYSDSQLWWVIMDANPKYNTELDIKPGDRINIPTMKAVDKLYGKE